MAVLYCVCVYIWVYIYTYSAFVLYLYVYCTCLPSVCFGFKLFSFLFWSFSFVQLPFSFNAYTWGYSPLAFFSHFIVYVLSFSFYSRAITIMLYAEWAFFVTSLDGYSSYGFAANNPRKWLYLLFKGKPLFTFMEVFLWRKRSLFRFIDNFTARVLPVAWMCFYFRQKFSYLLHFHNGF